MLVNLNSSCILILVRNPLDPLNAAYWLVVLGDLVIVSEHAHFAISFSLAKSRTKSVSLVRLQSVAQYML